MESHFLPQLLLISQSDWLICCCRVYTTLLASMCHAMPFLARTLKKNIFFDVDIVEKKQIEMWFIVVCTLIDNKYSSLLFSLAFFSILFPHIKPIRKSF